MISECTSASISYTRHGAVTLTGGPTARTMMMADDRAAFSTSMRDGRDVETMVRESPRRAPVAAAWPETPCDAVAT